MLPLGLGVTSIYPLTGTLDSRQGLKVDGYVRSSETRATGLPEKLEGFLSLNI